MEERYHATTQNRFYRDMSNVNKKRYYSGGKTYQPSYLYKVVRLIPEMYSHLIIRFIIPVVFIINCIAVYVLSDTTI